MRLIEKSQREPAELLQYRKSAGGDAHWDGFRDKAALKSKLLEDQGSLCCYCMRRISESTMKIEHYRCRSKYKSEELFWQNLLAACMGGEGESVQTCDTAKGDKDLTIDPRKPHHIDTLKYLSDGIIETQGENSPIHHDINDTLNLNSDRLKQMRTRALHVFVEVLKQRLKLKGKWSKRKIINELEKIRSEGPLRQFSGMFEYWLIKRLKRCHG